MISMLMLLTGSLCWRCMVKILILVMYGVSVISKPVVYGVIVRAPILTSSQEPRAPLAQL